MNNLAYFDPLLFKCPEGVIQKNTKVKFKVEVDLTCVPNEAYLMLKEDNETDYKYISMERKENFLFAEVNFENAGHYWYNFKLNYNDFSKYLSKTYDSYSQVCDSKGEDFFQLVINENYECTDSLQGGIIYQIIVDRFCKKGKVVAREPLILRDDWGGKIKKNTTDPLIINLEVFGGNFEGVISKLDYLKSLGVTTVYFNPICQANSNHKYDTANYMQVDDMFGDEQTFKKLIDEAKNRKIKIVIDGVYNHSGSDSIYFNKYGRFKELGAYQSKDSKYYDWYDFDEYPEKYKSWWGIDTLPHIKGNNKDFHKYIAGTNGVIEKFMKLGIAGVRLDVVDELPDEFVEKISKKVKSFDKNAPVIGEVWEDAATKISYSVRRKYFSNGELNSVMNYPIKESILSYIKNKDSKDLNSTLRMLLNNYPKVVMDNLMNFLATHDTGRIYTDIKAIAEDNVLVAKKLLKIATGIVFTVPGVPSILYGDEYGMENNDGSSRGCFDWDSYNNDIFEWYNKLTKIRKLKVFKDGKLNILISKNGKFVFERYNKNERVIVLSNLQEAPLKISFNGNFISLLSNKKVENLTLKENDFDIIYEKK